MSESATEPIGDATTGDSGGDRFQKGVTNALLVVGLAFVARFVRLDDLLKSALQLVIRRVLLAMGYPRLETSHPDLGTYSVGALRIRLDTSLPACQIFYPVDASGAATSNRKGAFVPYQRPKAVTGLVKFLEMEGTFNEGVFRFLQEQPHPLSATYGSNPLPEPSGSGGSDEPASTAKFPLVLFSHGLGGNMSAYTQLCAQLASVGAVVVAAEHADRSGAYAEELVTNEDGTVTSNDVWYLGPDYSVSPYSRQKMIGFRGPHLSKRVSEWTALYRWLQKRGASRLPEGEEDPDLSLAHAILDVADAKDLHLVGHSFGGSTQLLVAQTWAQERQTNGGGGGEPMVPLSLTVVDTWNVPHSDEQLAAGIPTTTETKPSVMSVLSENWARQTIGYEGSPPERTTLLEFLNNSKDGCQRIQSFYAKGSVHQSFADAEAYFPDAMAPKNVMRGEDEPVHSTIRAVVEGFVAHSGIHGGHRGGTVEHDHLVPFPLESE